MGMATTILKNKSWLSSSRLVWTNFKLFFKWSCHTYEDFTLFCNIL